MFALLVVAVSVGLGNLAAAVGLGIGGVSAGTRVKVAVIFGVLEAGMPVAGLALGHVLAASLGKQAHWLAGGLLAAVGIYALVAALRGGSEPGGLLQPGGRGLAALTVTGLALSLDNLAAGFALGSYRISVLAGAAVFGAVSVLLSLAGLELGARIGSRGGRHGELIGGIALIGVGVAIGFGAIG